MHNLVWSSPLQIVLSMVLLYRLVGVSSLVRARRVSCQCALIPPLPQSPTPTPTPGPCSDRDQCLVGGNHTQCLVSGNLMQVELAVVRDRIVISGLSVRIAPIHPLPHSPTPTPTHSHPRTRSHTRFLAHAHARARMCVRACVRVIWNIGCDLECRLCFGISVGRWGWG